MAPVTKTNPGRSPTLGSAVEPISGVCLRRGNPRRSFACRSRWPPRRGSSRRGHPCGANSHSTGCQSRTADRRCDRLDRRSWPTSTALVMACGADTTIIALGGRKRRFAVPRADQQRRLGLSGQAGYRPGTEAHGPCRRQGRGTGNDLGQRQGAGVHVGVRGGVGASSLSTATAWLLAQDHRKQVALVDLDLHFGTIALSLDLEPGNGLRSALENADRIDSLFVASALINVTENLFVLGGEEPLDQGLRTATGSPGTFGRGTLPDIRSGDHRSAAQPVAEGH